MRKKKLPQDRTEFVLSLLEEYKNLIAPEFNISLDEYYLESDTNLAETKVDLLELSFTVHVTERLFNYPDNYIKNVLLHEMVHGLFKYYTLLGDEGLKREEAEEMFINRMTTIIQNLLEG